MGSMAIRFSLYSLPILPTTVRCPTNGSRLVMMCANQISLNLHLRSGDHKNKVFEDQSAGIVCYKDENGEITCEGYDEGPRFHQPLSSSNNNLRIRGDEEIIELLQRCLVVHVSDEDEVNGAGVGTVTGGHDCNQGSK